MLCALGIDGGSKEYSNKGIYLFLLLLDPFVKAGKADSVVLPCAAQAVALAQTTLFSSERPSRECHNTAFQSTCCQMGRCSY